jgi:Cu/Zn superoxide dismutase
MKHLIVTTIFALCASPALAQSPSVASIPPAASLSAHAEFSDQAGGALGSARLTQLPKGVLIELDLKGLSPGLHGFHIHQTGKCEGAAKFASAGGHFAGAGHDHGYQSEAGPHAGDLPNLAQRRFSMRTGPRWSSMRRRMTTAASLPEIPATASPVRSLKSRKDEIRRDLTAR